VARQGRGDLREVDITIELPKTSTGKIQKFMLRDKEWAGHRQP
jgi:fatty-acyl-CoA synthase